MNKQIAILKGDGIGPEVLNETIKILKAIEKKYSHKFKLVASKVGGDAIEAYNNPYPKETQKICKDSDAILFGAIGHPKYDNNPNSKLRPEQGLLAMRKDLELNINIRPIFTFSSLIKKSPLKEEIVKNTDFVVYRELTSGIYFGKPRGRSEDGKEAYDTCYYSKNDIVDLIEKGFEKAMTRKKKITLVDKANVLATSRLWRECTQEIAKKYPEVKVEYLFVDNAAMQIILNPSQFDVIITENMFGDIITDEASVITGSLGILPSASIGKKHKLFEPIHGSYPQAANKNVANPTGAILSLAMMLEYSFGLNEESKDIFEVINKAYSNNILTKDLASSDNFYSTSDFGDYIAQNILN